MSRMIPVLGTHAWKTPDDGSQWWHPKSAWSAYMESQGLRHAKPHRPFVWTGDLDGTLVHRGNDWEVGAAWLAAYLEVLPYDWRNVVAHSHGGQVALLAAVEVPMRSLVMIGTPVRDEIEKIAHLSAANIGTCIHVSDSRWNGDFVALAGALFDRRWSLRRTFNVSGIGTLQIKGIGHSGMVSEPKHFSKWADHGLVDVLTATTGAAA
jgi:pimeloyl-ACP methyl ester carboxylesterase